MFLFLPELAIFDMVECYFLLETLFLLDFQGTSSPELLISLSCCFLITQPLNDGILSGLLALELHFPILIYMYIHIYLPIYHDSYLGHAICNQTILNLSSLIKGSHSRYLSTVGCLGALPHTVPSRRHKLIEQLPSEALPITLADCALIARTSTQE